MNLTPVKLFKVRTEKGLTKSELARKSGLNASHIGWIESGRFIPYESQLVKLAEALEVKEPHSLLEPLEG